VENLNSLDNEVVCVSVDRKTDVICKTCTMVGDEWLQNNDGVQNFRDFVGKFCTEVVKKNK